MLVAGASLFRSLSDLARLQVTERSIRYKIGEGLNLDQFLVPTQSVLQNCSSYSVNNNINSSSMNEDFYSKNDGLMYIQKFEEKVDVFSSKAKPKAITLRTCCGKVVTM